MEEAGGQRKMSNFDQWKVIQDLQDNPELPDPFLKPDGTRVSSLEEWSNQRIFLKEMLAHYMYGHMPPVPTNTIGRYNAPRN